MTATTLAGRAALDDLLTTVAEQAAGTLRARFGDAAMDLLGQATAIDDAVSSRHVTPAARDRAKARAGGLRDAAAIIQTILREENQP